MKCAKTRTSATTLVCLALVLVSRCLCTIERTQAVCWLGNTAWQQLVGFVSCLSARGPSLRSASGNGLGFKDAGFPGLQPLR
jgi:hypothetical protein